MKISVCIPMYNESSIIADCARTLQKYMAANFEDFEIIFSDDGSRDGSADIVRELALPNVRVVGYEHNRGKGCAVRTAMLAAEGDIVMFTDADLAYGAEVVGRLAAKFDECENAQLVIGSRNISADGYEGYTFIRKLASKIYIKVLCLVGGFKLSDSQCGCKGFRREAAKNIFSRVEVDGFAFDFEALLWAVKLGYDIAELPVKIINHRESKVNVLSDAPKMLRDLHKMKKRIKNAPID